MELRYPGTRLAPWSVDGKSTLVYKGGTKVVALQHLRNSPTPVPKGYLGYAKKGKKYWFKPTSLKGKRIVERMARFDEDTFNLHVERAKNSRKYEYVLYVGAKKLPKGWKNLSASTIQLLVEPRSSIRVLALDPGTANFAWSVVEYGGKDVKVLGSGMIRNTLSSLVGMEALRKEARLLGAELDRIQVEYQTQALCAERFMYRMGLSGTTMELVNIALGLMLGHCLKRGQPFLTFPASQWKNAFNKGDKERLERVYAKYDQVPHVLDATLIGIYAAAHWLGKEYYDVAPKKLDALLKSVCKRVVDTKTREWLLDKKGIEISNVKRFKN